MLDPWTKHREDQEARGCKRGILRRYQVSATCPRASRRSPLAHICINEWACIHDSIVLHIHHDLSSNLKLLHLGHSILNTIGPLRLRLSLQPHSNSPPFRPLPVTFLCTAGVCSPAIATTCLHPMSCLRLFVHLFPIPSVTTDSSLS